VNGWKMATKGIFSPWKVLSLPKNCEKPRFFAVLGLSPVEICAMHRLIVCVVNLAPLANHLERD
jgi:hypothetical protein